jgi:hypothetical protein
MPTITLALPRFGFVVATRAALSAGLALLLAERLPAQQRRVVGLGLIAIGAAATIPAARWVLHSVRRESSSSNVRTDVELVGATRFPRKGDDDPDLSWHLD